MFFIVISCLNRHLIIPHDRDTDKTARNGKNPKQNNIPVENVTYMVLFICHKKTALFQTVNK